MLLFLFPANATHITSTSAPGTFKTPHGLVITNIEDLITQQQVCKQSVCVCLSKGVCLSEQSVCVYLSGCVCLCEGVCVCVCV